MLEFEKSKCNIKLKVTDKSVHDYENRVRALQQTNKYNQTSINVNELAQLGIKMKTRQQEIAKLK